jgi:hypothetical protein
MSRVGSWIGVRGSLPRDRYIATVVWNIRFSFAERFGSNRLHEIHRSGRVTPFEAGIMIVSGERFVSNARKCKRVQQSQLFEPMGGIFATLLS